MLLSAAPHLAAFQHVFDEVDAPPRPIEFIAQYLVRGTGGIAESAMDATAQYGFRRLALFAVFEFGTQRGLHGSLELRV
jgi:hypothetical protein